MNDAELDDLIAATASVRDIDVARWDRADDDLCEEIMSMPTVTRSGRTTDDHATGPAARRPRGRWMVAAAAVAFVVAIAAAIAGIATRPGDPSRPTDTVTIEAALARSSSLLQGTARAEVRNRGEYAHAEGDPNAPGDVSDRASFTWEFSGEDFRHIRGDEVTLRVDGEEYLWGTHDLGEDFTWVHTTELTELTDVRTVIDQIRSTSTFTEVGTEPVDGVSTRRLSATDPGSTVTPEAVYPISGVARADTSITAVEIWVDDDDIVRRLDVTAVSDPGCDEAAACPPYTETTSIRFYDIGAPITIEAPTDYEEGGGPAS